MADPTMKPPETPILRSQLAELEERVERLETALRLVTTAVEGYQTCSLQWGTVVGAGTVHREMRGSVNKTLHRGGLGEATSRGVVRYARGSGLYAQPGGET